MAATSGTGGTITPASRSVKHGVKASFSVKANSGYRVDTVTGYNGKLSGTTYITGTVTADCKADLSIADDGMTEGDESFYIALDNGLAKSHAAQIVDVGCGRCATPYDPSTEAIPIRD